MDATPDATTEIGSNTETLQLRIESAIESVDWAIDRIRNGERTTYQHNKNLREHK